jgi:hypothetical protein
MAALSYDIDIACKGEPGEISRMWRSLSRPQKDGEAETRILSFHELAASAGKDAIPFTAPACRIDTGARVNSIRAEKLRGNPDKLYPILAKAFPNLGFFVVQLSFSDTSCSCASFEAKNGRMRQTGVWKDDIREAAEARRAWLGALAGHWLLESCVSGQAADAAKPAPAEATGGDHELARMEKQTARACLEAVQADGEALAYVRAQTQKICLAAVRNRGKALRFVKEQTPRICRAALSRDGLALEYVQEKTRDICLAAVKQNYLAYRYVEETSPAIYRQFMKGFQETLEKIEAAHQTAM